MDREKSIVAKVIVAIIAVVIILVLLNSIKIVRAGQRGVVLNWGAVSETVLDEGIHFKVPLTITSN